MKKVSFDCNLIVRSLIALLFVLAGLSKIGAFGGGTPAHMFTAFWGSLPLVMKFLPTTLAPVVGLAVIFIEIPVALLYALGYKKNWTGGSLIAFTALVTIFYHNPWHGGQFDFGQLINALKNIAIIGGILATLDCVCGKCVIEGHKKGH
jgi:uncharacterized membrane protein YphA (DoxX/SURF4 family)